MDFGDSFYMSHVAPAPWGPKSGDPTLPDGVYEISLPRPLGIEFEEKDSRGVKVIGVVSGGNAERSKKIEAGDDLVGVTAVRAVFNRLCPRSRLQLGPSLTSASGSAQCSQTRFWPATDSTSRLTCVRTPCSLHIPALAQIRLIGAKFERQMFDCTKWDFDTVVNAIGSNEERFGCEDVVLQFSRKA
jgi:hypothetical protein